MFSRIALLLLLNVALCHAATFVNDPVKDRHVPGTIYLKWTLDFNQDGINDVLLSEKSGDDGGIDDPFPDLRAFGVYLGQKDGRYINTRYVVTPDGRVDGGIGVDMSQCYVGYVPDVKQFGIVTALSKWQRSKGIYDTQVLVYTVEGDHIKETFLGGMMDLDHPNVFYQRYLSPQKRTKVHLEDVKIPN